MQNYISLSIICLLLLASCENVAQQKSIGADIFKNCLADGNGADLAQFQHDLFEIEYPANWKHDSEMKQGIDISSTNFPDSLQRGFMLSVVPFKQMYLNKNPSVDYFRFQTGEYNGFEAVYLTRNDLGTKDDESVYWRSELKLVSEDKEWIYILVFGRRNEPATEPVWCDFQEIIGSLKIKK